MQGTIRVPNKWLILVGLLWSIAFAGLISANSAAPNEPRIQVWLAPKETLEIARVLPPHLDWELLYPKEQLGPRILLHPYPSGIELSQYGTSYDVNDATAEDASGKIRILESLRTEMLTTAIAEQAAIEGWGKESTNPACVELSWEADFQPAGYRIEMSLYGAHNGFGVVSDKPRLTWEPALMIEEQNISLDDITFDHYGFTIPGSQSSLKLRLDAPVFTRPGGGAFVSWSYTELSFYNLFGIGDPSTTLRFNVIPLNENEEPLLVAKVVISSRGRASLRLVQPTLKSNPRIPN